jgi:hypothetical protein
MTLRHVVLVRFKTKANFQEISEALQALQSKIPGVVSISIGENSSPEGLQRGNTHGFSVDFVDAAARDAYLPHPEHQKVGAMIVAAAEGGVDGVTVVDWEV